ncbi:MAG: TonB family protein [Gemmatimonadaceae bacterium]
MARGGTLSRGWVLFLLLLLPGFAQGQEQLSWRNYEPGVHAFVPDSVSCGRRASELTEGLTESDRLAEYDRCLERSGWRLMTIAPARELGCSAVTVKALQTDSGFAGALRDGFIRRFRPLTPDLADVRLELFPTVAGLVGDPVGQPIDDGNLHEAQEAQLSVESDLAPRLKRLRPGATSHYLVTLRSRCVREFPTERRAAFAKSDSPTIRTEGIDFPFPGYLANVSRQIELRFDAPTRKNALRAEVAFLIHRDGSVSEVRFVTRSGEYGFDLEAQGAIEAAAAARAFGPLPNGFLDDVLPIVYVASADATSAAPVNNEGAYFEFQVEKTVLNVPSNSTPPYPAMLRSAGVEGTVLAQFVVDTSGKADMSTFKVLESSHELFTQAVRQALPSYRFFPAEIGGKKVRQVVQQPFTFALGK